MLEALVGQLGGSFLGGLGSSLGGPGAAGPSNATAAAYGSGLDGSGFSVNFAGLQTNTNQQDKSGGVAPNSSGTTGVSKPINWLLYGGLAVGAIVIFRMLRK